MSASLSLAPTLRVARKLWHSALALLIVLLASAPHPVQAQGPSPERTGYIVVFHSHANDVAQHAQALANGAGTRPGHVYTHAIKGFSVSLPTQGAAGFLDAMRRHPLVNYIEQDQPVTQAQVTTEPTTAWNLDRIDQRSGRDGYYNYASTGRGVRLYIIDSGLRDTHTEFSGRTLPGYTLVNDGYGTGDCKGHGTQVAGAAAGKLRGVAKDAWIIPVRVFPCTESIYWSTIVAALDWISANVVRPAAINMSLTGLPSPSTEDAVATLHAQGVLVVAAAGNDARDACNTSPVRQPIVMAVGAMRLGAGDLDEKSSYSNFGKCLDLFAPGDAIYVASPTSDTGLTNNWGTSFASPHVVGHVARLLEENPNATPGEIHTLLRARATPGTVNAAGPDSPLLMQYTGPDAAPVEPAIRVSNLRTSTKLTGKSWTATVQVSVRDFYAQPVAGATVTGRFSTATANQSCTTDGTGNCAVSTTIASTVPATTYTVSGVSGGGTYSAAHNFSNSVTVSK